MTEEIRKKVIPAPETLTLNEKNYPCPEEGCKEQYKTSAHLKMHVTRHHKRENLQKAQSVQVEYHCPAEYCAYNIEASDGANYFTTFKYLKQHFLKVHSKTLECENCDQKFFSPFQMKAHEKFCGIQYKCTDCENIYNTYESLYCHAKRKKHRVKPKVDFLEDDDEEEDVDDPTPQPSLKPTGQKPRKILPLLFPKPSNPAPKAKKSRDVGIQLQLTCCKCNCKPIYPKIIQSRNAWTQTDTSHEEIVIKRQLEPSDLIIVEELKRKKVKKAEIISPVTVVSPQIEYIQETAIQTLSPEIQYLEENEISNPQIEFIQENANQSSPQIEFIQENSETSGNLVDFSGLMNSSMIQTIPNPENVFYATEPNPLENNFVTIEPNQFAESNFKFLCNNSDPVMNENNIETQTAWSNLNNDSFVSTETQTAWPLLNDDFLVNNETQTFNEYSHIETQTDFILPFLPDIS